MPRSLLVLNGSPRPNGNSTALAEAAAAAARAAGAEVEFVHLSRLVIGPCEACDACIGSGRCVMEDDMQTLYPRLLNAGALLLASPIYWFTFNAQLKLCIDRWYALFNTPGKPFTNKPAGIVLTYGDVDPYISGAVNAIHTFQTMFNFLNMPIRGIVYATASDPGDIQKLPDIMEQAAELGRKLVLD